MSTKWYGSLDNRLEEGKMYCDKIEVGTPMTEYFYSDSHAWEVIKVFNQEHVIVRQFTAKCIGGFASNEWKLISDEKNATMELKKRYGTWWVVHRWRKEHIDNINYWRMPQDVKEKLLNGKDEVITYSHTSGKVSFGIAREYYDYSF